MSDIYDTKKKAVANINEAGNELNKFACRLALAGVQQLNADGWKEVLEATYVLNTAVGMLMRSVSVKVPSGV